VTDITSAINEPIKCTDVCTIATKTAVWICMLNHVCISAVNVTCLLAGWLMWYWLNELVLYVKTYITYRIYLVLIMSGKLTQTGLVNVARNPVLCCQLRYLKWDVIWPFPSSYRSRTLTTFTCFLAELWKTTASTDTVRSALLYIVVGVLVVVPCCWN
jgi:hypothetical protein